MIIRHKHRASYDADALDTRGWVLISLATSVASILYKLPDGHVMALEFGVGNFITAVLLAGWMVLHRWVRARRNRRAR